MGLLVFVAVGVATHEASALAFGRDALCILGGWFAAAAVFRLYARGGRARFAATWLLGVSAGVWVRAAIVGHLPGAFYGVALGFTLLFVLVARRLGGLGGAMLVAWSRWAPRCKDAGSADSSRYRRD